jgi:hypothetical protein
MQQVSVVPWFFLILVAAVILMALALALRNSQVARHGGVAAGALAIGVLALGWMLARHQGLAVSHGPSDLSVHDAAYGMKAGWGLFIVLAAIVAVFGFALRGASPQTRSAILAGGGAVALLAIVLGSYTTLSDHSETATIMESTTSLIPLDSPPKPQKSSGRRSPSKAKKSKSSPVTTLATTPAPLAAKPRPPEPADDQIVAVAAKPPEPAAAPPAIVTTPEPGNTNTTPDVPSSDPPATAPSTASIPVTPRPDWLEKPAEFTPDGAYTVVVRTNPVLRLQDALRELESKMRQEARAFVELNTRRALSSRSPNRLPWDYIAQKAKVAEFKEIKHSPRAGTNMVVIHAQLTFTPQLQGEIEWIVQQALVRQRTTLVLLVAGFVLAIIGVLYGYLRLDTATKGYYTWRLRFLALLLAAGAFGTMCGVFEEYDLDNAFDTVEWQSVAQTQSGSGRLR